MRGFLGGLVVGLGTVSLGTATVSVLAPLPPRPEVESNAPKASRSDSGDIRPADPEGADPDLVKSTPSSLSQGGSPEAAAPEDVDTQSAQKPEVSVDGGSLAGPEGGATAPELSEGETGTAAMPEQAQLAAPQAPISDADARISSEPTQPPTPVLTQPEVSPGARPSLAGETPQVQDVADTTDPQDSAGEITVTEVTPDQDAVQGGDPGADLGTDLGGEPARVTPKPAALPQIGTETATADNTDQSDGQAGDQAGEQAGDQVDDQAKDQPETAELSPGLGTPATPIIDTQNSADAIPTQPKLSALDAHAAAFDAANDRPLMAIVLMDLDGAVSADALADFPYPVTFALDPSDPGAPEKMERHRSNGHEVVMLVDLPPATNPQGTEAAMQVWQSGLPQTVAILEGVKSGFQTNRAASEQMMDIALASGHGLITQSNGLNTVQKLASKAGVPSSVVFRDFDGTGQTPTVIRRFLDQAAFRAGQEGGVIMLGRLQPDTISALILWGLQDRAQRVALAPVSAVLVSQSAQE